ncbi:MAG: guanosine-3',5'-bis(diphosphate) 3'-pyrophosphohydrolase [marine bacterium B5-7]|nr:MAG: guanosine-3',5'-bis(diphosphate) 3'-pyrophosphohydrolase [marine bacterium B5-7]
MDHFSELHKELSTYLQADQIAEVKLAYQVAERAHEGQTRRSGEPYITHPVAAALILAEMHLDKESIMAAILHDVLEDTDVSKEKLAELFGEQVANLVDGVSKLTQIKFETRAQAQAENFRKMVLAMVKDIRVILVKLADRLHNMRTLGCLPPEKKRRIARETLEIFAPISNRLGMHNFRVEFEDLGFSALYPMRYRILKEALSKSRGNNEKMLGDIKQAVEDRLKKANIQDVAIWGREKHLYSIYKKMRQKRLSFNEVMDIYAFRIIVKKIDDCYRILGIVHNLYKPVPERFKDYIAIPKVNGYQSLHTTLFGPYGIPIEMQIRTREMNNMADSGITTHWLYKSDGFDGNDAQQNATSWVQGLLDLQKSTGTSLEFIENVKFDLFKDEVYVFTPKGNIMQLPAGATPVDFAYTIHSDIGNCCVAVRLNRRLAPLSEPLQNGQTVEVITAPNARPNPAWLDFVVTGKARSNIRHFMKNQQRHESVNFGRKLLSAALEKLHSSLNQISADQIELLVKHSIEANEFEDVLEQIGLGNQMAALVANRLLGEAPMEMEERPEPVTIRGSEGVVVSFARCCQPIPGDPITGLLKAGHGLEVHLDRCRKLTDRRKTPERYIPVRWEDAVMGEFTVDLTIEVANQRGTLAVLTQAFTEADSNIHDLIIDKRDGRYNRIQFTINVKDRQHLAYIMRHLRKIKTISRIARGKLGK